ncbi:hypothetical protein AGMMS49593_09660 [Endomicrobiia bacterium]|nr:hypothetical protein AGMMS49593_09660 [Endomicrobiia bacterium]
MRLKNFLVYASIMPILTCFISTQAYANPPEDERNRSGIFMHTSEGLTHSEGCTLINQGNASNSFYRSTGRPLIKKEDRKWTTRVSPSEIFEDLEREGGLPTRQELQQSAIENSNDNNCVIL